MAKKKTGSLNQLFENNTERHKCKSKKEGRVIVVACLAATKIFDSPIYRSYYASQIKAIINGKFIPLETIKEEIKAKTINEAIKKFPFPEDTLFFQMFFVKFGHLQDIILKLEGKLEKGKIKWGIKSVFTHGYAEILTKEELKRFS